MHGMLNDLVIDTKQILSNNWILIANALNWSISY